MEERDRGDMGLAKGELPWGSTADRPMVRGQSQQTQVSLCPLLPPPKSKSQSSHWPIPEPVTVDKENAPGTNRGSPSPARRGPVSPAGIMTDKAVAEADLMTLPPVREGRFSTTGSPDSCWCRARRRTRSLVALRPDGSPSFEDGQRSPGRGRSAATEQMG